MALKDTPWAYQVLAEGADILDSLGLKWWLSAGTMLGVHREGDLIPHDDDLDVGVQLPADHGKIKEAFKVEGFETFAEGSHQLVFKKRDIIFDIYFYSKRDDKLICDIHGLGQVIKPYKLFVKLGTVTFKGRKYPTPKPIDEYLTVRYGDWQTPKKEKRPWAEETPALHLT